MAVSKQVYAIVHYGYLSCSEELCIRAVAYKECGLLGHTMH